LPQRKGVEEECMPGWCHTSKKILRSAYVEGKV
jgi:hypothetical protein